MKFLTCITAFLFFSLGAHAQTKAQVKAVLDGMAASGNFTEAQVAAAKRELDGMSEQDLSRIVERAMKMKDDPAIKAKIKSMNLEGGLLNEN